MKEPDDRSLTFKQMKNLKKLSENEGQPEYELSLGLCTALIHI